MKGDMAAMTILRTVDIVRRTGEVARAILDGEKVVIARPKNQNWVIMSEIAYNEVMREKANAEYLAKLKRSDEDYKAGRVVTKTLDELKTMESNMP
jgi:antitoxin YefM